jgi:YVTN family beta-propeller protein
LSRDPLIGTELLGYQIEALVGRGGMGVVYVALDPRLKRRVALKLLAPELAQDSRFRERFLAESELAASLEHPHVVPIYDAGESNGRLYIVMRYVEGRDLRSLLHRTGRLDPKRALAICAQVADALDTAHARGLVHRDVKPSNILLDERERAFLADFGLTRRSGDTDHGAFVGSSLGTPAYVAPEQIEDSDVSGAADQYALACVLFECLNGTPPFSSSSPAGLLFAHLAQPPPSLPGLDDVLGRALAKSPEHRYGSCKELVDDAGSALGLEKPSRARWPFVAAGAGAALLAGALLLALTTGHGGSQRLTPVPGNTLVAIDPHSNRTSEEIPVGTRPGGLASGFGSLWVANRDDATVSQVDPASGRVARTYPVGESPSGIAVAGGSIWVAGTSPTQRRVAVLRLDPQFGIVQRTATIDAVAPGTGASIAADGSSLWVAPATGLLSRLDPRSGRVVAQLDPGIGPISAAARAGGVWLTDDLAGTLTEVAASRRPRSIPVGDGPSAVAVGDGSIWVADTMDDTVVRIDPRTRRRLSVTHVGRGPSGLAIGLKSVWVANSQDGTVTRIDASSGRVIATIPVGSSPQSIVVADGRVWVSVQTRIGAAQTARAGGVAVLNTTGLGFAAGLNPADAQIGYATCARLVNYPDAPAPAGQRLIPELAQTMPTVSRDGRTYTFVIRPGFRFSPRSGQVVTAATVAYTLERNLSKPVSGGDPGILSSIAGAPAYAAGRTNRLAGIVAHGNRLTIRLTAPQPDLLWRLAQTTCVVPIGTPFDANLNALTFPSAGPYYVSSYVAGQGVVLSRNPNYGGERPHHLDRIELTLGVSYRRTMREVEAGTVDFAADGVPLSDAARLAAKYGRGSPAAKAGAQQYFVDPFAELDFLVLNTHRPLFRSARLRRAVNFAVDRRALSALGQPYVQRGLRPTDQYIPPGIPGFRDAHVYPFTPDLQTARRLAGPRRRTAVMYTCNDANCKQVAALVSANLAKIGIEVRVKTFNGNGYFQRLAKPGAAYDIAAMGWLADGLDPWDFLNLLLEGNVLPTFDDPEYRAKLAAAAALSGTRRYLAYARLDADLARNAAPWVAYGNAVDHDFFSARIGCQVYNPIWGVDLAALCLRKA